LLAVTAGLQYRSPALIREKINDANLIGFSTASEDS